MQKDLLNFAHLLSKTKIANEPSNVCCSNSKTEGNLGQTFLPNTIINPLICGGRLPGWFSGRGGGGGCPC